MSEASEHCECTDVQSAALSNHLHCLQNFWQPGRQEPEFASTVLQSVAAYRHKRPWSSETAQSTDCTGCLSFILGAGVRPATELTPTREFPLNALSSVAAAGCVPCLRLLLDSLADETVSKQLYKQAVKEASRALKLETLTMLLDAAPDDMKAKVQQCAFLQACQRCNSSSLIPLLEYLHREGCDVNSLSSVVDRNRCNNQRQSMTALACLAQNNCQAGVRWLIEVAGADVNATYGNRKYTALHVVSTQWSDDTSTETIQILVELGADMHAQTSTGETVLHTSVHNATAMQEFVTLCNRYDSNSYGLNRQPLITQQDENGYTPLHTVVHCKARRHVHDKRAKLLSILLTYNDRGLATALTKQDKVGRTVLHWAVLLRQLDELQMLLAAARKLSVLDSVLHTRDHNGTTAVALVRCIKGSSLKTVIAPYCTTKVIVGITVKPFQEP
jgi:Ankyrin repeats (3 copies)